MRTHAIKYDLNGIRYTMWADGATRAFERAVILLRSGALNVSIQEA